MKKRRDVNCDENRVALLEEADRVLCRYRRWMEKGMAGFEVAGV